MTDSTFAEQVWNTLSRTDVIDHVEQLPSSGNRPSINYLPWDRAWMLLKRHFPASTFEYLGDLHHVDGTVEVETIVTITDGSDVQTTRSKLAVMDNRFNAVKEPDARLINDARQRVLVKALAFAGLGLNLWSESMLPVGKLADPINDKQITTLEKLIKAGEVDLDGFLEWCEVDTLSELPRERYAAARSLLEARVKAHSNENS